MAGNNTWPPVVTIVEVGPRDGFQNVKDIIPAENKTAIIDLLVQSGLSDIEFTSFVNPKTVPQMADAKFVAKHVMQNFPDIRAIALVPNFRGAQNAWEAGLKEITYVVSASEGHNQANVARSIEQSLAALKEIREGLPGLTVRVSLATAFACPFAGVTQLEDVLRVLQELAGMGVQEIVLCDTIGVANPRQVYQYAFEVQKAFPNVNFGLHLHNTRGMGLANMLAGMKTGIKLFETAVGGLGGCPFAPGAAGNTATEDAVNMLHSMGVQTNVNMKKLLQAVQKVEQLVPAPLTGNMKDAKIYDNTVDMG